MSILSSLLNAEVYAKAKAQQDYDNQATYQSGERAAQPTSLKEKAMLDAQTNAAATTIPTLDDEPRVWVKIPGLDPKEPNALRYMNEREIDKLGQRAGEAYGKINRIKRERAKAAAERARQAALRIFTPGCAVKLDWLNIGSTTRRRLSDIGTARGLYVGHASNPVYAIVVFEGLGQRYVENSFLVRA